jgi:hypothetical protein
MSIEKCPQGHMYSSDEYKSCPYCKIYEKKKEEEKEARRYRAVNKRELHVNTKWENFCIWFDEHFGVLADVIVTTFRIITAPLRFLSRSRTRSAYSKWSRW